VALPNSNTDARSCIRHARNAMRKVRELLLHPSEENAEQAAGLLRDAEIQLGCARAAYQDTGGSRRDPEVQKLLADLQAEIAVLAQFFAEADKLLAGWLYSISTRQAGYTTEGQAAPLVLLKKVSVEG